MLFIRLSHGVGATGLAAARPHCKAAVPSASTMPTASEIASPDRPDLRPLISTEKLRS